MPYVSSAQEKFFNANRDKLEAKGVNVDEWNKASKGLKLPEHVKKNIIKKVIKKKDGKGGSVITIEETETQKNTTKKTETKVTENKNEKVDLGPDL